MLHLRRTFFFLARRKYQPVRTHGLHTVLRAVLIFIERPPARYAWPSAALRGAELLRINASQKRPARRRPTMAPRGVSVPGILRCTSKNAKGVSGHSGLRFLFEINFFFGSARLRETDLLPYTPGPHPGPLRGIFLSGVLPRGGRGLARRGIVELLRIKCFSQRASRRRTTAPQGASLTFPSEHAKTRTHSGLRCIVNTFFSSLARAKIPSHMHARNAVTQGLHAVYLSGVLPRGGRGLP